MERTFSSEERIRRAEEIYQRRKMQGSVRVSTREVNNSKKEITLFKKMILQIVICVLIYFIFYLIKNSNYIFSENVINNTKAFLTYDINFQKIYETYMNFINKEEIRENVNEIVEENIDNVNNTEEISKVEDGIGGGEEGEKLLLNENKEENIKEEGKELTQMEIDAKEIKEKYSLIIPLKGTISSRFGTRTPTEVVSANHAGIDIARDEGTVFVAAMEGIVTEVLTEGGYGNHIYIQNGEVTTLYAHCKTIYLKEGTKVNQGEVIGEVGHTGNATGPHLHFEIRKNNRVVNPEYVLDF